MPFPSLPHSHVDEGADVFPALAQTTPQPFFSFQPPRLSKIAPFPTLDQLPKNAFGIPDYRQYCDDLDRQNVPADQDGESADACVIRGVAFQYFEPNDISESEVSSVSSHPPLQLVDTTNPSVSSLPPAFFNAPPSVPSISAPSQDQPLQSDHSSQLNHPEGHSSQGLLHVETSRQVDMSPQAEASPQAELSSQVAVPFQVDQSAPSSYAGDDQSSVPPIQIVQEDHQRQEQLCLPPVITDMVTTPSHRLVPRVVVVPNDFDAYNDIESSASATPMSRRLSSAHRASHHASSVRVSGGSEIRLQPFQEEMPSVQRSVSSRRISFSAGVQPEPFNEEDTLSVQKSVSARCLSISAGIQPQPFHEEPPSAQKTISSRRISFSAANESEPFNEEPEMSVATPQFATPCQSISCSRQTGFDFCSSPFVVLGRTAAGALVCDANGYTFVLHIDQDSSNFDPELGVQCSPDQIVSEMCKAFGPETHIRNVGVQTDISMFPTPRRICNPVDEPSNGPLRNTHCGDRSLVLNGDIPLEIHQGSGHNASVESGQHFLENTKSVLNGSNADPSLLERDLALVSISKEPAMTESDTNENVTKVANVENMADIDPSEIEGALVAGDSHGHDSKATGTRREKSHSGSTVQNAEYHDQPEEVHSVLVPVAIQGSLDGEDVPIDIGKEGGDAIHMEECVVPSCEPDVIMEDKAPALSDDEKLSDDAPQTTVEASNDGSRVVLEDFIHEDNVLDEEHHENDALRNPVVIREEESAAGSGVHLGNSTEENDESVYVIDSDDDNAAVMKEQELNVEELSIRKQVDELNSTIPSAENIEIVVAQRATRAPAPQPASISVAILEHPETMAEEMKCTEENDQAKDIVSELEPIIFAPTDDEELVIADQIKDSSSIAPSSSVPASSLVPNVPQEPLLVSKDIAMEKVADPSDGPPLKEVTPQSSELQFVSASDASISIQPQIVELDDDNGDKGLQVAEAVQLVISPGSEAVLKTKMPEIDVSNLDFFAAPSAQISITPQLTPAAAVRNTSGSADECVQSPIPLNGRKVLSFGRGTDATPTTVAVPIENDDVRLTVSALRQGSRSQRCSSSSVAVTAIPGNEDWNDWEICFRKRSDGQNTSQDVVTPNTWRGMINPRTFFRTFADCSVMKNIIEKMDERFEKMGEKIDNLAKGLPVNVIEQSGNTAPESNTPESNLEEQEALVVSNEDPDVSEVPNSVPALEDSGSKDKLFTGENIERSVYALNRLRCKVNVASPRSDLLSVGGPSQSSVANTKSRYSRVSVASNYVHEEVVAPVVELGVGGENSTKRRSSRASVALRSISKRNSKQRRSLVSDRRSKQTRSEVDPGHVSELKNDSTVMGDNVSKKKRQSGCSRSTITNRTRSGRTQGPVNVSSRPLENTTSKGNERNDVSTEQDASIRNRRRSSRLMQKSIASESLSLKASAPSQAQEREQSKGPTKRKQSSSPTRSKVRVSQSAVNSKRSKGDVEFESDVIVIPDDTPEVQRRCLPFTTEVPLDAHSDYESSVGAVGDIAKGIDLVQDGSVGDIDLDVGGDDDGMEADFMVAGDALEEVVDVSNEIEVTESVSRKYASGRQSRSCDVGRVGSEGLGQATMGQVVGIVGIDISPIISNQGDEVAKMVSKKAKRSKRRRSEAPPKRPRKKMRKLQLRGVEVREIGNHEQEENEAEVRRSRRQRFPVLKYWRNENVQYERRRSQQLPTIKQVVVDVTPSESDAWFPGRR